MAEVLYIGNDMSLTVTGLKDEVSGDFINNATVTARLRDRAGNDITGQSWPATLTYVTGSNGIYRGTLEDGLDLDPNKVYRVEISVDAGSNAIGFWRYERKAIYRTS